MKKLLFIFLMCLVQTLYAQGTQTSAVRISNQTQVMNNKKYYIHIVEQGQTVFSIARAYGLKYYDAVIKSDIHQLKVGDTVWLPFNEYSVAAVSAAAKQQTSSATNVHYIKVDAGQTLYGLAREYGTTVEAIVEANPELRHEQLKAGQMLKIPPRQKSYKEVEKQEENPVQTAPEKAAEPVKNTEPTKPVEPKQPVAPVKEAELVNNTEPVKPVEPKQPVAPVKATEPVKNTEPAKPVEPKQPVAPVKAIEPVKNTEPVWPVEPKQPVAPVKAAEPVKNTDPAKPVEPKQSVAPVKAAEPVKNAEPAKPVEPKQPVVPVKAAEPEKKAEPAKPVETKQPVAPVKATEPEKKAEPDKPVESKQPVAPVKAAEPVKNAEPAKVAIEPEKEIKSKIVEEVESQPAPQPTLTPGVAVITNVTAPTPVQEPAKAPEQTMKTENVVKTLTTPLEMDYDPYAKIPPSHRAVQNPYPFNEVPNDFPTQRAGYYNFTTPSTFGFQVREMQSKSKVYITVVMPLNLSKINEISTSKFDIEQRGKKDYKIFEFVQFYEGLLIALDELQERGYDVVLNVVDLSSEQDADVVKAWEDYHIGNSDLVIALLVKKPFEKLSELARTNQVFVINPFSLRSDVVENNPYVVKYMPSTEGVVKSMLDVMATRYKGGNLYLIHSNNKSATTNEKEYFDEFQRQLSGRKDIKYTLFDWTANGKLVPSLKSTDNNVIISIYNQDNGRNTVFANTILNRLSTLNTNVPVLMTTSNWLVDYPSLDFEQLQHLNYSPMTTCYLDYYNPHHKQFIDTYKSKFKTEPNGLYAGVAHDIMYYFVTALSEHGAEFWRHPESFAMPSNLLFPLRLKQCSPTGGYENQAAKLYQMQNYRLQSLNY